MKAFSCHTQSVERLVKEVSAASARVCGSGSVVDTFMAGARLYNLSPTPTESPTLPACLYDTVILCSKGIHGTDKRFLID